MNPSFQKEWRRKLAKVRASEFYREVSLPPAGRVDTSGARPRRGAVIVDDSWRVAVSPGVAAQGPARTGLQDLRAALRSAFGLTLAGTDDDNRAQCIVFVLSGPRQTRSRWDRQFTLTVSAQRIEVRANTEAALLRASLYLSNLWRLRRIPALSPGRRIVRPRVPIHIGADLWGGFSTTQAPMPGREKETNWLELARMGVNAVPVMTLLEDYIAECPRPFRSLNNPKAAANLKHLAALAKQAAAHDIHLLLMGYNPKLDPNHRVFRDSPASRGAMQFNGAFRVLCTSDRRTREFLADQWARLFERIPELGGILAINGGEGFYHCFMRSSREKPERDTLPLNFADDCPRCRRRTGDEVAAEIVNSVARAVHRADPDAILAAWPYSGYAWSADHAHTRHIAALDPNHVIFQTEIDKDQVEWRPAGYGKYVWDYSLSCVRASPRCLAQQRLCRARGVGFSVKIECNNSIDCLSVPYLPALDNQRLQWEHALALKPRAIHSRWLFAGSCKSPAEELGFWAIWGAGTEFADLRRTASALAQRDFGARAGPRVERAWSLFSEALRHHPCLSYYIGSYIIGPAQPLVLDASKTDGLAREFFGLLYWQWESSATNDDTLFRNAKPLFFSRPGFSAIARRGPSADQDVGLSELRAMAGLWMQGVEVLRRAGKDVPARCRQRFIRELDLAHYLALTWRSAANVEEFLRLRDRVRQCSTSYALREGYARENRRDLARMETLIRDELTIGRIALPIAQRDSGRMDVGLRLDLGAASIAAVLKAKVAQIEALRTKAFPAWRAEVLRWQHPARLP